MTDKEQKLYRVRLTWPGGAWSGHVLARDIDYAVALAKYTAGAPERATSETQRVDGAPGQSAPSLAHTSVTDPPGE